MKNTLILEQVELHTYWDNRTFPKHYPAWRPKAQWTKLVGESWCNNPVGKWTVLKH